MSLVVMVVMVVRLAATVTMTMSRLQKSWVSLMGGGGGGHGQRRALQLLHRLLVLLFATEKLEEGGDHRQHQAEHQHHKNAADVIQPEGARLAVLVLQLVADARQSWTLPPFVVHHLNLTLFLKFQYL